MRDFAGQALKAGQGIPQWNPYLFGGLPYIAAMHGDIFYPTALLRLLLPTDIGLTWGFVIHIFLAGCFTYGFLRAWGLGFYPSLVGGIAYMMSGDLAGLVSPGHDGKLFVSALMPLTLWLLVRGIRDGRHWAWGGIALTVGLAVLSPHPQLLQYMLLTTGAFGLFLDAHAARRDGTRLTRREGVTRLALALGAVVLGGAIGAVQYFPVAEYVPFSPRAGGKGLGARRQLLDADRGADQRLPPAVQRHPRSSTGAATGSICTASTSAPRCCCSRRPRSAASSERRSAASGPSRSSSPCSGRSAATRRSITSSTRSCRARSISARRAPS